VSAALVAFVVLSLVALTVAVDDEAQRERAKRQHPSNHHELADVTVTTIPCEFCRQPVYEVATTGDDLLAVLWLEWDDFDFAVDWHREFECKRVPV